MNALKAKASIECNTCGCAMHRQKTIKVSASEKQDSVNEARDKIEAWKQSLKGKNCKVCQSILNDVAA